MPVIAINLSSVLFGEAKRLVEEEKYESVEQFLEIAAYNQLALEKGATAQEVIARGHREVPHGVNGQHEGRAAKIKGRREKAEGAGARRKTSASPTPVAKRKADPALVPVDEIALVWGRLSRDHAMKAGPTVLEAKPLTADQHLFGQLNRLFGLKITCRFLAFRAADAEQWPKFEEISDALADDAAAIGSWLEQEDAANGRKRDDQLATGLPRRGNPSSRDRFLSQFVARTTRAGDIYPGAVVHIGLAAFTGDRLGLTEAGREFARLPSPALDGRPGEVVATLGEEEQKFLRRRLPISAPSERRAWEAVRKAIQEEGHNTPDALVAAIKDIFPADWSQIVLRTHIAGVISRMAEVGLLSRRWEGRNVKYETATSGGD
jgi:hypothetical protein